MLILVVLVMVIVVVLFVLFVSHRFVCFICFVYVVRFYSVVVVRSGDVMCLFCLFLFGDGDLFVCLVCVALFGLLVGWSFGEVHIYIIYIYIMRFQLYSPKVSFFFERDLIISYP